MFRKTIAVGPFEPVASCVTGGTAVAIPYLWLLPNARQLRGIGRMADVAALLHTRRGIAKGLRNDMIGMGRLNSTLKIIKFVELSQFPSELRIAGLGCELGTSTECQMPEASPPKATDKSASGSFKRATSHGSSQSRPCWE